MFAYQNNYQQTAVVYFPSQYLYVSPRSAPYVAPHLTKKQLRRAEELAPFCQNKGDAVLVPPVVLKLCTEEPRPQPLVTRWATVEWRARRLAARRRYLPVRSRPGAR